MMKEKRGAIAGITVLAVVLAVLVAVGGIYYNKVYKPTVEMAAQETTSYKAGGNGPQKSGKRTLVAENDNVSVYKDGDFVIIAIGKTEAEFSDWNENFGSYDTEVYYADFDDNGKKDIVILDVEGEGDIPSKRMYGLYVLTNNDGNSENPYNVHYTNSSIWLSNFTSIVTCSLNQPKAYPETVQFVMDYNGTNVPFDSDTGLAMPGYRAWYTKTPQTEKGKNATLKSIRLSNAYIDFDEKNNDAKAQIYVYAVYSDSSEQNVGIITSGIDIYDGELNIKEESVAYTPNKDIAVSAPKG